MDKAIDHLVFATNDLREGREQVENLLGIRASPGGSHPGMGTRNALLSLGPRVYLEIIGPDPDQPDFEGERIFGIDAIDGGKLVHWCVRRVGLATFVQLARSRGMELGDAIPLSRVSAQGDRLDWYLAFPASFGDDCALPFFIDWGTSSHPASSCPRGAELTAFEIQNPDPGKTNDALERLSIEPCALAWPRARLRALIQCPRGEVELL